MYIQVNIGRNVGPAPMSDDSWSRFKSEVKAVIIWSTWGGEDNPDVIDVFSAIQVHEGLGEWDGIPEVSAHISYFSEVGVNYRRLRDGIAVLRDKYMQDSIALVGPGSELI